MTSLALKKQIHKAIDLTSDESILEAVYTILNKTHNSFEISKKDMDIIEGRRASLLKGESKTTTVQQIRKRASKHLK